MIKNLPIASSVDSVPARSGLLLPYQAGVHFGIVQACLFLTIQCFFTATVVGYFAVMLAWMCGALWSLCRPRQIALPTALLLSLVSSYGLLWVLTAFAPGMHLIPVIFVLVALAATPVGALFRSWPSELSGRQLFLHENNGFVLGYVLSILGFVEWGVNFLYWAPLVSFASAALAAQAAPLAAWIVIVIVGGAAARMGSFPPAAAAGVVALMGAITYGLPRQQAVSKQPRLAEPGLASLSAKEARALLVLAGACAVLLQFWITREFSSTLAACELSILVIGSAYLAGFSVGYAGARWFSEGLLRRIAPLAFASHLLLFLVVRPAMGYLIDGGFGWQALLALLFICAFLTSSFYSILLPKLLDARVGATVPSTLSWDVVGAGLGLLLTLGLAFIWPALLWPAYLTCMAGIVLLLMKKTRWRPIFATLAASGILAVVCVQPAVLTAGTEDYYASRGYDHPKLMFTEHSPYHSVEVLDTFHDPEQTQPKQRAAFLNGVRYFTFEYEGQELGGETGLSEFTYFLAELPAKYLSRAKGRLLRVLVLGGGSMQSLSRLEPYSEHTTLVEIDPLIVRSARECWAEVNAVDELDMSRTEIIIDDARHYLMTTDETFDLIVLDISAPYYLGTSIIHCREFFELVKTRLRPDGIFSESTQSRPRPSAPDAMGMRILRAVADVFPRWRVVDGKSSPRSSHGYVYATEEMRLRTDGLVEIMKEDDRYRGTATYVETTPHFRLERSDPFRMTDMSTLLTSNAGRIERRLRLGSRSSGGEERGEPSRLLGLLTSWSRGWLWGWIGVTLALAWAVDWGCRRKALQPQAGVEKGADEARRAA